MKKYKEFIKNKETIATIPVPIHFKYVDPIDDIKPATIPSPIHFKYVKEDVGNIHPPLEKWLNKNDNTHLTKGKTAVGHDNITKADSLSEHISKKLRNHQAKNPESDDHKKTVEHYTDESRHINKHLLDSHKIQEPIYKHLHHIKNLDHLTSSHKLDHDLHVYSGVGFHPGELTKHSNGILKSPAFISTTHSKHTARSFARRTNTVDGNHLSSHIIHLHLKKGENAYHTTEHSVLSREHETIIPRDTNLKIHPKPTIYEHGVTKYHIWHAEIDHSS